MGLTITKVVTYKLKAQIAGGVTILKSVLDVAFDSSYPAGGETLDLSLYAGQQLLHVAILEDTYGYLIVYDPAASWAKATGKIKVYLEDFSIASDAPMVEATGVDLSSNPGSVRIEVTSLSSV